MVSKHAYLLFIAAVSTTVMAAPLYRRQDAGNLQPFTSAVGGISAPAITKKGTAFDVDGESFTDLTSAIRASCDSQCAECRDNADANGVKPEDCGAQRKLCLAGANGANGGNEGAETAAATEKAGNGGNAGNDAPKAAAATDGGAAAAGGNLQKFTGNLGAPCPTVINDGSNRPFKVEGNANFDNLQNALIRSCDVQFNKCQNVFNAQPNNAKVIQQGDCQAQKDKCDSQARTSAGEEARTAAATDGTANPADAEKIAEVVNNGSKEGADVQGDANAANQDANDDAANKAVDAGLAPPPAADGKKGGIGGVDPATGETLLPLPDVSDFCSATGQIASDGTQIKTGMCSSVNIGQIPNVDNMVSSLVLEPANGAVLKAGDGFTIKVQVKNMDTGFFTEAATEYYTQPQTLDDQGLIKGHVHVTVQNMGDGQQAPDANVKAFFKGLNDKAQADGTISTDVPAGTLTEAGTYRICTLTGAFSHQPVVMPIAQRGAQDDCIRVTVE